MTEQDKELFSQIYYQYYKRLLYTAVHIIHNFSIAEELTNETFTILLAQFDQVRNHPNLDRWLYTVLTNQALNELKKQKRYIHIPLEELKNIGCEDNPFSFFDVLPDGLSKTDKEILYLRYEQNMNCAEIARYLSISHDASRARLCRAKGHFIEWLSKEHYHKH